MSKNVADLHELDRDLSLDPLTGLRSRGFLEEVVKKSFERIRQETREHRKEGVALIFVDLDGFKKVNDTFGHAEGDRVLRRVAGLIKNSLRETDVPARYGGDEFVAFLPNTSEEHAIAAAEHVRKTLAEDPELKSHEVTASLGVCSSDVSTAATSEDFIHDADIAAYKAKQGGKNQVVAYKEGMKMENGKIENGRQ